MENLNSTQSQPNGLERDANNPSKRGRAKLAVSASRTQKQSPISTNMTSGSFNGIAIKGPTSNLRSLAGQLLMSGSSARINPGTLNQALLQKNSELQTSVKEQLLLHQHLIVRNKEL